MQKKLPTTELIMLCALLIGLCFSQTTIFAQQPLLPGQWAATTLSSDNKVRALLVNGTTLLAGTNTGVWSTTDSGTAWTQINTGLTTLDVRALAISGTTIYAGTNGGGVFRSTDGTNWTATNTGLTHGVVNALVANSSDVYLGTNGGGVFRLSGTTWTAVNNGISASAQVYSLLLNGNDLWAGGQLVFNDHRHIFRTSDRGATWTATGGSDTSVNAAPPTQIYSLAVKGATLLAASLSGLYRSTDNGANWRRLDSLPLQVLSVLFDPDSAAIFAAGLRQDGELYGVSVSTDNGATWRAASYGLPGSSALAIVGASVFAAATNTGGVFSSPKQTVTAASVSAASYQSIIAHSSESIATVFGVGLATQTAAAVTTPLPTTLGGTTVTVRDSLGLDRAAPLFYVDQNQVSYQVPAGTAAGWASLTIKSGDGALSYATAQVTTAAFSLFTADATGSGVPAAYLQRVRADGGQQIEIVGQYDAAQKKWVTVPIDLGPESDQVFLVLFGTGFRGWNTTEIPVIGYFNLGSNIYLPMVTDYAGKQDSFVGLDQVNIRLPRSLAGKGEVGLYVTANGGPFSNTVKINVR